ASERKEHVVCPACGKTNRVASERLTDQPKCGSCGALLFQGHPTEIDSAGFDRHLKASTIPVLVDVWAPWCGPCRSMAPMFERAAQQLEPNVRLVKLNMDTAPQIAARFGVQAVPTLMLLKGGRVLAQESGARDSAGIVNWVRQ